MSEQLSMLTAFCCVSLIVVSVIFNHLKHFHLRRSVIKYELLTFTKQDTGERHPLNIAFKNLINEEGAGTWPPRANYKDWPAILRPYHEICLEVLQTLSTCDGLLDDEYLKSRRNKFRQKMRDLLSAQIDLSAVISFLKIENAEGCPRNVLNAFYCCIAVSRHAYRWAVIPVVKIAQEEIEVEFPLELDLPWSHLQNLFGLQSDSGNNSSNVLHNFDEEGNRMYRINHGMSRLIEKSEDNFYRLFRDVEVQANGAYDVIVQSVLNFERGDEVGCITCLKFVASHTQSLLRIFYQGLTEDRVSKEVWLSYVQGFQGWGLGRYIDGKFVKYDGISGSHVLFFQALDAFLGIERYLSDENWQRSIPKRQREFCDALRKHCFRVKVKKGSEMDTEFKRMVQSLKTFRAAHRKRVMPYLKQPASERLVMTAGQSVADGAKSEHDLDILLKPLEQMLTRRLHQTGECATMSL